MMYQTRGDLDMSPRKLDLCKGLSKLSDKMKLPMYLRNFTFNTFKGLLLIFKHVLTVSVSKGFHKNMDNPGHDIDEDTRQKGFQWCRDSLRGSWATISEAEFEIKQISGGLTNMLYLCSIPNHINVFDNEPRTVLLRIYGEIAKTSKEFLLRNSVIFAILSEKRLGPKLYCMHPEGRLEEYIPTRCLSRTEILRPDLSQKIAQKLALFHSLEMPLCKEPKMLKDTLKDWLVKVENILQKSNKKNDIVVQKLLTYNLREELDTLFLKDIQSVVKAVTSFEYDILSKVESPVRFCHNDLQEGNLLYLQKQLTAIDWEYCSYNYRGFDLGNHFCEWCFDYQNAPDYPYYSYHPEDYPSRQSQYAFFREYLSSSGTKQITEEDLQNLYIEANTFALASHFFWALWSVVQKDLSDISFGFLEYAEIRLDAYFKLKQDLPDILNGE